MWIESKCIFVVGPKGTNLEKPAPLVLYGRLLPWVEQAEHLGTIIHQDGTFSKDVRVKRAKFIDQSCKIREDFYFAHPLDIIHAVETYAKERKGKERKGKERKGKERKGKERK